MNIIINYFYYFLAYSFLGWLMESTIFTIKNKKWTSRGFLTGPICPVYGSGMVVIIYFLTPQLNNPVILFFLGGLIATIIEYFTGYILDVLFKTKWWDYSTNKFNLNGYICALNSFYWCVLSVLMMYVVQPIVQDLLSTINAKYYNNIAYVLFGILLIDTAHTVIGLIGIKTKITKLHSLRNEVVALLKDEKDKIPSFNNLSIHNMINTYKNNPKGALSEDVINKLHDIEQQFNDIKNSQSSKEKSLTASYPHAFVSSIKDRLNNNHKKDN
ncbi:MAG: putative ABC transporter permease [Bacilli bacterium]